MENSQEQPKLYHELADWWQLISPTSDYNDEGPFFNQLFKDAGAKTLLELGCGGGNIATYLKNDFHLTLSDLSPEMLRMSQAQNPECEHVLGDMRSLRLNQTFDGVFIHDAVMYILSEEDLLATMRTAYEHCNPGGMVVIAPDCTKENLKVTTDYEGHDDGKRGARYIQWITDENPDDTVFKTDFIIALRDGDELRTVVDRQINGIFPRQTWLDLLEKAGFVADAIPDVSTQGEAVERVEIFIGRKPVA